MLEFLPGPVRSLTRGMGKLLILVIMVLYVISPVDLLPEAVLGPIGLIDDLAVIIFGVSFLGFDLFKGMRQKRTEFQGRKE